MSKQIQPKRHFLWVFSEDEHQVLIEASSMEEAEGICIAKRVELAGDPGSYGPEVCKQDFYDNDRLFELTNMRTIEDMHKLHEPKPKKPKLKKYRIKYAIHITVEAKNKDLAYEEGGKYLDAERIRPSDLDVDGIELIKK